MAPATKRQRLATFISVVVTVLLLAFPSNAKAELVPCESNGSNCNGCGWHACLDQCSMPDGEDWCDGFCSNCACGDWFCHPEGSCEEWEVADVCSCSAFPGCD